MKLKEYFCPMDLKQLEQKYNISHYRAKQVYKRLQAENQPLNELEFVKWVTKLKEENNDKQQK